MNNNGASTLQRNYWDSVIQEVAALKDSAIESEPLDLSFGRLDCDKHPPL